MQLRVQHTNNNPQMTWVARQDSAFFSAGPTPLTAVPARRQSVAYDYDMITTLHAPDLRQAAPRSGSVKLGDFPWLARLADKARAELAGTAGNYEIYCDVSKDFLQRCGIGVEEFLSLIRNGASDADLQRYFETRVDEQHRADAAEWIAQHGDEIRSADVEEGRAWARTASARWTGDIRQGEGTAQLGGLSLLYAFDTRFGSKAGSSPEQLLAAAHAACYSMALSLMLGKAGHKPQTVETTAKVTIAREGDGFRIAGSDLECNADVPGIGQSSPAVWPKRQRTDVRSRPLWAPSSLP